MVPWAEQAQRIPTRPIPSLVHRYFTKPLNQLDDTRVQPSALFLNCHTCGHGTNAANKSLISQGKWASIYCSTCKLARKASQWHCECGIPWNTCVLHRQTGLACKRTTKPPSNKRRLAVVLQPLGSAVDKPPPPACASSSRGPMATSRRASARGSDVSNRKRYQSPESRPRAQKSENGRVCREGLN